MCDCILHHRVKLCVIVSYIIELNYVWLYQKYYLVLINKVSFLHIWANHCIFIWDAVNLLACLVISWLLKHFQKKHQNRSSSNSYILQWLYNICLGHSVCLTWMATIQVHHQIIDDYRSVVWTDNFSYSCVCSTNIFWNSIDTYGEEIVPLTVMRLLKLEVFNNNA
jgi:hypothetical protein